MKLSLKTVILTASLLVLGACGNGYDGDSARGYTEETQGIALDTIKGVCEKGPFLKGSKVVLYELDSATMEKTGKAFSTTVINDKGEFLFENVTTASTVVLFEGTGYYIDDVTGKKSKDKATIYSLVDLQTTSYVNVNFMTTFEYKRIIYLMKEEKMSFDEAQKQASEEVLEALKAKGDFKDVENNSIFGDSDESAYLFAMSVVLQVIGLGGDINELLESVADDIEKDGTLDDVDLSKEFAKSLDGLDLEEVRKAFEKVGDVPDFEKFVCSFAGDDAKKVQGCPEYSSSSTEPSSSSVKDDSSSSSEDESPSSTKQESSSSSKNESSSSTKNGSSSSIKGESSSSSKIVSSSSAKEVSSSSLKSESSSSKKVESSSSITSSSSKKVESSSSSVESSSSIASSSSLPLPKGNCPAKGEYGYKSNWENLDKGIDYDCIQDARDNQYYKTVKIGGQIWLAENLNYSDEARTPNLMDGNWCYGNDTKNCESNGRLYNWAAAMDLGSEYNGKNADGLVNDKHQGVCPSGWHVPNNDEWDLLEKNVDDLDGVGFSALLSGYYPYVNYAASDFELLGSEAYFWTASQYEYHGGYINAYSRIMETGTSSLASSYYYKSFGQSVRCLRDDSVEPTKTEVVPVKGNCPAKGESGYKSNWEYLNEDIDYECFQDSRDNQYYKTVVIGEQTWLAENLNYGDETRTPNLKDGNWCYDDDPKNCEAYGHLYTWAASMDLGSEYNSKLAGDLIKEKHQGICPSGWHVPNSDEWDVLKSYVDGLDGVSDNEGYWLKATSGWSDAAEIVGNGIDGVGFAALPSGIRHFNIKFLNLPSYASFWGATEGDDRSANLRSLGWRESYLNGDDEGYKSNGNPVRCLKD